jgi:regulatory protein
VIVTALDLDPRGSGGVRVQVDGGPFATVSTQDIAALGLELGRALDAAAASSIERRAEAFAARAVALRMLGYRALPAREITRRLTRKGHARPVAEAVVSALEAEGLVNDAEFARHFTLTRATRRRYGPSRLEADLRRLGVDEHVASAAVRETLEREAIEPRALLLAAAERKLKALAGLDVAVQHRRLRAYLLRRGFAVGDVVPVIDALVGRPAVGRRASGPGRRASAGRGFRGFSDS